MVIVKFIRSPERTPAPAALIRTRVGDMINHTCKTDQKNPDKTKVIQSINTINKKESNEVFTAGIKDKRWPLKQGIRPDFLTLISSIVLQDRNMTERTMQWSFLKASGYFTRWRNTRFQTLSVFPRWRGNFSKASNEARHIPVVAFLPGPSCDFTNS